MTYRKGTTTRVRIEGHPEPVPMVPILKDGFCAGAGVMLAMDRGDGMVDKIVELLNASEANE